MKLIDVTKQFAAEDACLDYFEQMRWPGGLCCIKWGMMNVSRITREKVAKNKRRSQGSWRDPSSILDAPAMN